VDEFDRMVHEQMDEGAEDGMVRCDECGIWMNPIVRENGTELCSVCTAELVATDDSRSNGPRS
jgi:uncharacterized Zn finger protein (UPF0148 family)